LVNEVVKRKGKVLALKILEKAPDQGALERLLLATIERVLQGGTPRPVLVHRPPTSHHRGAVTFDGP
jgi:hypothetical protein